jgi:hypothetical protein
MYGRRPRCKGKESDVSANRSVKFFAALPPCLVGMEACATAHYWAREFHPDLPLLRCFFSGCAGEMK